MNLLKKASPMQRAFAKSALPHTAIVFSGDSKGFPETQGSATLLAVGERRFIITCAHVGEPMAKHPAKSAVCFANYLVPEKMTFPRRLGDAKFFFPEPKDRKDTLDVCVIELPAVRLNPEEDRKFMKLSGVSLSITPTDRFVFVGLPEAHCEPRIHEKERAVEIVGIPLVCRAKHYKGKDRPTKFPYEPQNHFLLEEKRKRTMPANPYVLKLLNFTPKNERPELFGMSGSGIWAYTNCDHRKKFTSKFRLVGVEFAAKHGSFTMCTRIGCALRVIYREYPMLEGAEKFVETSGIATLTDRWR